jgi:hypothetical protein
LIVGDARLTVQVPRAYGFVPDEPRPAAVRNAKVVSDETHVTGGLLAEQYPWCR